MSELGCFSTLILAPGPESLYSACPCTKGTFAGHCSVVGAFVLEELIILDELSGFAGVANLAAAFQSRFAVLLFPTVSDMASKQGKFRPTLGFQQDLEDFISCYNLIIPLHVLSIVLPCSDILYICPNLME